MFRSLSTLVGHTYYERNTVETKYRILIFLRRDGTPNYIEMKSDKDIIYHAAEELGSEFDFYVYEYNGEHVTVKIKPNDVQAIIKNTRKA